MKEFKYKTSFSSKIKCIVDEDKDQFLSRASLESLKKIIPDSVKGEADLLAIAFNSCVPNLGNKNGDMIDDKTALAIYKSFINKPINIEHERITPIGHIVGASFSEFSSDFNVGGGSKIIEASDIKGKTEPFNLALSAVLYRLYNSEVVREIEESSDPNSDKYLSYSASWELAFDEYALAVGSRYLSECRVIEEEEEIEEYKQYLLDEGGTGKTPDGEPIFRLIKGEIIPLGIGITENPAAEVAGITSSEEKQTIEVQSSLIEEIVEALKEHKEKNSQIEKDVVKANNDNNQTNNTVMEKIKTKQDITDELLKKEGAKASVMEFIDSEVNRISEEYTAEKAKVEKALTEANEAQKELQAQFDATSESLKNVQAELDKLVEANQLKEAQEAFDARMTYFDGNYKLDEKTRDIVANRIKGLSDEDYQGQKEELEVLLASVKVIQHEDGNDDCGCDGCCSARSAAQASAAKEAKASVATEDKKDETPDAEAALESAKANAEKENAARANSSSSDESLEERAARVFGRENWEIKKSR